MMEYNNEFSREFSYIKILLDMKDRYTLIEQSVIISQILSH